MRWFFICFFSCVAGYLKGQSFNDFASADSRILRIPSSLTHSTTSIAGYVQSNFKTDVDKLRAIYTWVINNIRYDKDSMYAINWSMYPEEKIAATLRRRKGVCENYASLFTDIAIKSGFRSFVVSGFTKQWGSLNAEGHSWSAVYVDDEWFLCDPTWDVGTNGNTNYFMISPAQFIDSHIPFDPLWQLLDNPGKRPGLRQNDSPERYRGYIASLSDSAKAFLQLDSLKQLEESNERVKQAGLKTDRQKHWLAYNKMKVAIIYGEKDMNLYNAAVEDLNKANAVFNEFVQYRNNRFLPVRPDAQLLSLLQPIKGLLTAARRKLDQTGQAVENFQYDTSGIQHRIGLLNGRVQEQQQFLNLYLAAAVQDRERMFYK